jgi:hypothetical protein
LKPASDSGSQASGGAQDLEQRVEPAHGPGRLPHQHAQADAHHHGQRIAIGNPRQAGQQLPGHAFVVAAVVIERVDDQLPGIADDLGRRWQRRALATAQQLPDQQQQGTDDHRRQQLLQHEPARALQHAGQHRRLGLGLGDSLGGAVQFLHFSVHGDLRCVQGTSGQGLD